MVQTVSILYFAYWASGDPDEFSTVHIGIATSLKKAVDISKKFMKDVMHVESSDSFGRDRIVIEGWQPDSDNKLINMDLKHAENIVNLMKRDKDASE